jgi:hypothetical protein
LQRRRRRRRGRAVALAFRELVPRAARSRRVGLSLCRCSLGLREGPDLLLLKRKKKKANRHRLRHSRHRTPASPHLHTRPSASQKMNGHVIGGNSRRRRHCRLSSVSFLL